jgi:hypothetical protein
MKWYTYLKWKEGYETRFCLKSNENIMARNILIRKEEESENGDVYMKFGLFKDHLDFVHYILSLDSTSQVSYHEVIQTEAFQKPYFDVDIPTSAASGGALVNALIQVILRLLPTVTLRDVMTFSSNSTAKESYHVVVDRWMFSSQRECKAFYEKVMSEPELLELDGKSFIDPAVYASSHSMRCFLSKKTGTDRMKVLDDSSTWRELITSRSDREKITKVISASLITNTSYCSHLPSFHFEEPVRRYDSHELASDDVKGIFSLLPDSSSFKVHSVLGSMILLKRLCPSHCPICLRVHENTDPFITVNSKRDVTLHCRRSEKKFPLGSHILTHSGQLNSQTVTVCQPNVQVAKDIIQPQNSKTLDRATSGSSHTLAISKTQHLEAHTSDKMRFNPLKSLRSRNITNSSCLADETVSDLFSQLDQKGSGQSMLDRLVNKMIPL